MAISFKSYAPTLAWRLGSTTSAALYERQRVLVGGGLLKQSEGRGPGSGVSVTPHSLALLLLAVLTTDSLSDTAEKVRIFAKAKSTEANHRCPWTGASNFADAIARALDPSLRHGREITNITVGRTSGVCLLKYARKGEHVSKFMAKVPISAELQVSTRLEVEATIQGDLIRYICEDLREIDASEVRGRGITPARGYRLQEGKKP